MVTIVPAGKEEKNDWCRQHGLPADCLALIAECAGRPVGYVLYALGGGRVTLLWAEADDRVLLEALVRAAITPERLKRRRYGRRRNCARC